MKSAKKTVNKKPQQHFQEEVPISHYEFIEYQANHLSNIYVLKEDLDSQKAFHKKVFDNQRWMFFRNTCIILLYASLFLSKPNWCLNPQVDELCRMNSEEDIYFFTNQRYYMSDKLELVSWFIMLILIVYDLILMKFTPSRTLGLTILFLLDSIFGFLFMNGMIDTKINLLFRFLFVVYYPRYTSMVFSSFISFIWLKSKMFQLVISVIAFTGMLMFVLYFDEQTSHNDVYYNKLSFTTILNSIYSSYMIFTSENSLNIINFTLIKNPMFLFILIPLFFGIFFIFTAFVIAMICKSYSSLSQKAIKNLPKFSKVEKVLEFFKDSKGFINLEALKDIIYDFYNDPNFVDFMDYNEKQKNKQNEEKNERKKIKKLNHNSIHQHKFLQIKNSIYYRFLYISIDTFIALLPILILNCRIWGLNDIWYFTGIVFCGLSCIDPFLCLNFIKHRITKLRRNLYQFKFMVSLTIIILALLIPTQSRKNGLNLEQSNDLLFIFFSIFCFLKLLTIIDELLFKNKLLIQIFKIFKQVIPIIQKIFVMIFLMIIFYSTLGIILYGGKINSQSIEEYQMKYGINIVDKFEFFNFNDFQNGCMTLFVLLLNNNWIYVTEMLYFVKNDIITTMFITSYGIFVQFFLISLILGMITKVVVLYFDSEFQLETKDFNEEISQEVLSDSDDENEEQILEE